MRQFLLSNHHIYKTRRAVVTASVSQQIQFSKEFIMRYIGLATLFCVTAAIATVCGAPPARQSSIDQQHQLIEAQQEDDRQREKVEEINKQVGGGSHDSSGSQIAADHIRQFDRARETRAAQYWELLGITVPLQQPLAESQRIELDSFIRVFAKTAKSQLAVAILDEHNRLMRAAEVERQSLSRAAEAERQSLSYMAEAKALLERLQLKTTAEEMSEAQLTQLIELNQAYPKTEAAAVAKRYLRAHSNRRFREDAENAGLLTPGFLEKLATQRLADAQDRYGNEKAKSQLREELGEIVDDYPGTQASQQAAMQIIEVQKAINAEAQRLRVEAEHLRVVRAAEAERSRLIREYWDAVYPDRVRKQDTAQR